MKLFYTKRDSIIVYCYDQIIVIITIIIKKSQKDFESDTTETDFMGGKSARYESEMSLRIFFF